MTGTFLRLLLFVSMLCAARPASAQSTETPSSDYADRSSTYQRQMIKHGGSCSATPIVFSCKRPLAVFGNSQTTVGRRSTGPELDGLNPFFHQYLCVQNGDSYLCGGQTVASGIKGPGINDEQSIYDGRNCTAVRSGDTCLALCLTKQISSEQRPFYSLVGNGTNCQEWANYTLQSCEQYCLWSAPRTWP